jgi:hypothetical protein
MTRRRLSFWAKAGKASRAQRRAPRRYSTCIQPGLQKNTSKARRVFRKTKLQDSSIEPLLYARNAQSAPPSFAKRACRQT